MIISDLCIVQVPQEVEIESNGSGKELETMRRALVDKLGYLMPQCRLVAHVRCSRVISDSPSYREHVANSAEQLVGVLPLLVLISTDVLPQETNIIRHGAVKILPVIAAFQLSETSCPAVEIQKHWLLVKLLEGTMPSFLFQSLQKGWRDPGRKGVVQDSLSKPNHARIHRIMPIPNARNNIDDVATLEVSSQTIAIQNPKGKELESKL